MITIDKQNNDKIDQLLQMRQDSLYNGAKANLELLKMGVKVGHQNSGEITLPGSFDQYLEDYSRSNLEFEWLAEYKDGTTLQQFGPGPDEEHHFGHIEQDKLASISFISNFNWPTDNTERRVVVSINWEDGLFNFLNGFASQDVKAKVCVDPITEPKKLILIIRRRESPVVGDLSEELKPFYGSTDEIFYYNRFILGFETPSGIKKVVMIQPNGNINLLE